MRIQSLYFLLVRTRYEICIFDVNVSFFSVYLSFFFSLRSLEPQYDHFFSTFSSSSELCIISFLLLLYFNFLFSSHFMCYVTGRIALVVYCCCHNFVVAVVVFFIWFHLFGTKHIGVVVVYVVTESEEKSCLLLYREICLMFTFHKRSKRRKKNCLLCHC